MRWFKHMVNAWDDEKLARLFHERGFEGYGFYWRIIEILSKSGEEPSYKVTYPRTTWRQLCGGIHQHTWRILVEYLERTRLLHRVVTDGYGRSKSGVLETLSCPNIQKIKDEWAQRKSKNSGVTRESLGSKDPDPDPDPEKNKKPPHTPPTGGAPGAAPGKRKNATNYTKEFEKWWRLYGPQGSKPAAFKRWKEQRRHHSADEICDGTRKYLEYLDSEDWRKKKDGAGFLNQAMFAGEWGGNGSTEHKPPPVPLRNRMFSKEELRERAKKSRQQSAEGPQEDFQPSF